MITNYENYCLLCGRPRTDIHHLVWGNSKRQLADSDGLTIPLCKECHNQMHHSTKQMQVMSHIVGQLYYELNKCAAGMSVEDARKDFRGRYGVSYL